MDENEKLTEEMYRWLQEQDEMELDDFGDGVYAVLIASKRKAEEEAKNGELR